MGRKILMIGRQFFNEMLKNGERHYLIENGLPEDAKIVKMSMDAYFSDR